ncbi:ATP-binding protein [Deinococcus sp. Arct2-2]|uniref:sensor histidine kinase n=1 Tax=Deinococcus sp. Arct2-2 TaxID=2568653 RepID=UPI001454DC3A|nr:ATP-binding protein [Deinococcus sp. Arct2-2]
MPDKPAQTHSIQAEKFGMTPVTGGEMGQRIREFDWAATPLGTPEQWPAELRTCLNLMLASQQPMFVGWTHDMIGLYNDAYRVLLGQEKHPAALGARLADTFGEDAYPALKPVYDALLNGGVPFAAEGALVPLNRDGYLEECYFDFAYTPIYRAPVYGTSGKVDGLFVACTEVSERVIGERRTHTLARLTANVVGTQTAQEVAGAICDTLTENPHDAPMALLYLPGPAENAHHPEGLHLAAATRLEEVLAAGAPERLPHPENSTDLQLLSGVPPFPAPTWPEPVTQVAALPLLHNDGSTLLGLLVVGLNPRKKFDEAYQAFLQLLRGQAASALMSAYAFALERAHVEQARQQAELLARQNAQLEARARALQGFSDLTRDLNVNAPPHALAQRALAGLMTLLPEGYASYFELKNGRWYEQARAGHYGDPGLEAAVAAGLPYEATHHLRVPWETEQPFYQSRYDADTDSLPGNTSHAQATACLPVLASGRPIGIIGCGLFAGRMWSAEDRAVVETIVQSLGLAIEGAQGVAALQQRTAELVRSNAELERFASVASHDLQEPLRTITSFSELLRKRHGDDLNDSALKYLDFIQRGGQQMKALVDDLLAFSRLSEQITAYGAVSSLDAVRAAQQRLSGSVAEAGAHLQTAALPVVCGDLPRLTQLFQNLLGNALKFRREGTEPEIMVTAEQEGTFWHFRVTDNGIGMEPEAFEQVFVMFKRLHARDEYQGTGLGLAICQRIVEDHGGRIWVESVPEQGSTFHFTLPGPSEAHQT